MTRYILDTDHVSLLQQFHPLIRQRVKTIQSQNIGITVVTIEEQMRGWLNAIRQASQASQSEKLIAAYAGVRNSVIFFKPFEILEFTEEANNRYIELRRQLRRLGTQDLRIASIVLSVNGIIVTRNNRDFSQIPELVLEDWTV
ncbi:type II toxin-antitoxin system VapC family toxin [Ancylothrix sp. C2]|uniref:type II toxin-antitoxin system VapC family toxin n=1 Tax=Ancylothrix sp. D3o TaxID=2953691 RepID=UPI0021BBAA64|nr:type II toxin-antitoxin system VapC family toxin [Ancylothrix sp. D3o]MCT7950617.1 type II toxin-antitoxin system VapC family toxin [Ancylothrix sp. D3o]